MLLNYVKIALRSLLRRKFFTAISLFGIGVTLMVLLIVVALLDQLVAPEPPETKLDRTLHAAYFHATGGREKREISLMGKPGYALLDRVGRDLPGVRKMSIVSEASSVVSFVGGEKIVSTLRRTDGAYWEILDFKFLEGRPFTPEDEHGAAFVAVISEATRRRFFNGEPAVGRFLEADGQRFQVVGVVADVSPTRLSATGDIWVPHSTARSQEFRRELMRGGFTGLFLADSRADFPAITAEFESRLRHTPLDEPFDKIAGTLLTRFGHLLVALENPEDGKPPVGRVLLMVLGMVAAFLVLPTLNLVSINLSRILERSAEIGVSKAFGASSVHLVAQFIVENVVLCIVGGLLGLAGAVGVLKAVQASGVVPYARFDPSYRVFLSALALGCFFGVLSGLVPAWRMSRMHPVAALRGGSR